MVKGIENLLNRLIAEIFPNHGKDTDIQIKEAYKTSNRHDQKRSSPPHVVIKLSKVQDEERLL
jgi:hypothetical protein